MTEKIVVKTWKEDREPKTVSVQVTEPDREPKMVSVTVIEQPKQEPIKVSVGIISPEEETQLKRPKRYNASQLAKAGVEMLDLSWLRCMTCGAAWSPNLRSGGKLPRGYWKCPNGCNEEAK